MNLRAQLQWSYNPVDSEVQWIGGRLAKERSWRALDERSTFVHCSRSLQSEKRVSERSQGNWRHLASECLKQSRAQKPFQQKDSCSATEGLELGPIESEVVHSAAESLAQIICAFFFKDKVQTPNTRENLGNSAPTCPWENCCRVHDAFHAFSQWELCMPIDGLKCFDVNLYVC